MKYTPGPWSADPPNETSARRCWTVWPSNNPDGYPFVCGITQGPWEESNAHLIAAAPELLDAARLMASVHGWAERNNRRSITQVCDWKRIYAAIAKATGQMDLYQAYYSACGLAPRMKNTP